MSTDNKNEFFDLLAHEKQISDLYQNNKEGQVEGPSAKVDAGIMAIAKLQLSDNHSLMTKEKMLEQQGNGYSSTPYKVKRAWQWPLSLVASVGILSVLFITQNKYFIAPTDVVAKDTGILNAPAMRAPNISMVEPLTEEVAAEQSFQVKQVAASAQKAESQLRKENITITTMNRMSLSQTPKILKEQMFDKSMLEDNLAKITPMSLLDISKLAELLKLELATQNMPDRAASASRVMMQQTLFQHLTQYQKSHADFELTEKYLSVLTEKQARQLKSVGTEAVLNN
jgi:hypothetical protein